MTPESSIAFAYRSTPKVSFRSSCVGEPRGVGTGVSTGVTEGLKGFRGSTLVVNGFEAGRANPDEAPEPRAAMARDERPGVASELIESVDGEEEEEPCVFDTELGPWEVCGRMV